MEQAKPSQRTSVDFDASLAEAGSDLVVAYFWGDDCPNCDVFKADWPALQKDLTSTSRGLRFFEVNAYQEMDLARRYGLFGVPAFLLFRGGKLLGRMSQYYGRDYFLTVVRETLAGTAGSNSGGSY